jgi:DNA repair exonuclease SbcCD ATPase subunit
MLKNQDEVKQKRDKIAENEARMQAIEAQVQANIRAYNAQVAAIDQQDTEATHDEDVPQPGLVGSVLPLATPMVVGDQRNVTEASLMEKLRKLNTLPPPPMSAQDTQRIKALIDQRNKLKQKKELLEEANERLNKDNQHLGGSGAGGSSTSCTAQ